VDADQVLAFRLARSGLAARSAGSLAEAAACPAPDFSRNAALLALAARAEGVTRDGYDAAVESGELVVAYVIRGAIHALAPDDHALYGRAVLATDEKELAAQLGRTAKQLCEEHGIAVTDALDEVAGATRDALSGGARLAKNELHEALRQRVRDELLPWCRGCESHHVSPMMWRYASVAAGARLDADRRYLLAAPGDPPPATRAVERFLRFYGPSTAADFADWAGIGKPHAKRLWDQLELDEVRVGTDTTWLAAGDAAELESPAAAEGVRLLPPGDPYLQKPNRPVLAPDADVRKRLFRPVASPGAVLKDGRLVGMWRTSAKGTRLEVTVEKLGRLSQAALDDELERLAGLRGAKQITLVSRAAARDRGR
jgi:hypothetical protein